MAGMASTPSPLPSIPEDGNYEFGEMTRRMIAAFGRRTAVDVAELPHLAEMAAEVDKALENAVRGLRSAEGGSYSWAQIGAELGVSAQAACSRWKHVGGARQVGGQPAGLR
jgi:hypothetical protein